MRGAASPAQRSSGRAGRPSHADDFGMSRAASDGILHGFEHGLLTSTSLLANAPDAGRAMEQWPRLEKRSLRRHTSLDRAPTTTR